MCAGIVKNLAPIIAPKIAQVSPYSKSKVSFLSLSANLIAWAAPK